MQGAGVAARLLGSRRAREDALRRLAYPLPDRAPVPHRVAELVVAMAEQRHARGSIERALVGGLSN